jgi:glycosyltransferase involved in cell wall biosynthesis
MRNRRSIIFAAFQTDKLSNGGLESATRIFEALADRYNWTFITTRETAFTARWRKGGAQTIVTPFQESTSRLAETLSYARWAAKILAAARAKRADCIHANDIRAFTAASLPARVLRLPVLLTVRDTKAEGEVYGRHWRRAALQCQRIVTLSDEMKSVIAERTGASLDKVRTINSIVDLERFAPSSGRARASCRSALAIAQHEFAVGCAGAVCDKKNQVELIEKMLPLLIAGCPDTRVHFFGDFSPKSDPYAARCASAVERLGMQQRVVFHGHTSNMAETLKVLDAVVIGSRREGLARAMIEGMACGLPVVSFSVCSAREMLDDTGAGQVVPIGDYIALAKALIRLAADPQGRAEIGRRGRLAAEQRFDAQRIRGRYVSLYDEIFVSPSDAKRSRWSAEEREPQRNGKR